MMLHSAYACFLALLGNAITLTPIHAAIEIAQYGGCLNSTRLLENPGPGDEPAFHCHFDSEACADGEEWLNPGQVSEQNHGPCTCDDTFSTNVYGFGCYDMEGSHTVKCTSTDDQCPTGWYHLGSRFNNKEVVSDDCGDGTVAFGGQDQTQMCGKRCTCHYHYASGDNSMSSWTTQYGVCYNMDSHQSYCAVSMSACDADETYFGSLSSQTEEIDCSCDKTETGACMNGETFSHCSVASDGCLAGQNFHTRNALADSAMDIQCRLCQGEEPDETSSPTKSPTKSPTRSPSTPMKEQVEPDLVVDDTTPVESESGAFQQNQNGIIAIISTLSLLTASLTFIE